MLSSTKIFGAPGTGKTTKLIKLVEEALSCGIAPNRIGYFSMTNKATNEVKERMAEKFTNYDAKKDFPYFRTMHSMAYALMGKQAGNVISTAQVYNWAKINRAGNVKTEEVWLKQDDPKSKVVRVKHVVLDGYSAARAKDMDFIPYALKHMNNHWTFKWLGRRAGDDHPVTQREAEYMYKLVCSYVQFKGNEGVVDFEDMLFEACMQLDNVVIFDVLFIDEAQDLSPMQWKLARAMADKCEMDVYVAGDPDQAIYDSFGAESQLFRDFPGREEILPTSWRLRKNVFDYVCKEFKYYKTYDWSIAAREGEENEEGRVVGRTNVHALIQAGLIKPSSDWLILAPTKKSCEDVSVVLQSYGMAHFLRNEPINGGSHIKIQTIHSSKGGEADNVVIITESGIDERMLSSDALRYVACTRARKFLAPNACVGMPERNFCYPVERSDTDEA